jgi:UrcA family protein
MLSCNRNVRIVAVTLVPLLIASLIDPVNAAILPPRATSVTVRYRSGDLDTPQGVAGVYRRIRGAAETVCGQPDDVLMLEKLIWSQCVEQAITRAVASVHSESLSAYRGHQIRGHKRFLLEVPESLAMGKPTVR